jgi:hypothetical protein
MAGKWSVRLIAMGALALAVGCRSHPAIPVCTTPLFPEDVVRTRPVEQPSLAAKSAEAPEAPLLPPSVLPPPPIARLPESAPVVIPKEAAAAPVIRTPPAEAAVPKPADDGFVPAGRIPAVSPDPVLSLPDSKPDAPAPATPLKPGEKFGHAPDYHWVAGTLDRHLKSGYWTIRYADIGDDDPWGGKVRLLNSDRLKGLHDGDIVYVEGDLLAPASAADTAAYPPFRVTALSVIEKVP